MPASAMPAGEVKPIATMAEARIRADELLRTFSRPTTIQPVEGGYLVKLTIVGTDGVVGHYTFGSYET